MYWGTFIRHQRVEALNKCGLKLMKREIREYVKIQGAKKIKWASTEVKRLLLLHAQKYHHITLQYSKFSNTVTSRKSQSFE